MCPSARVFDRLRVGVCARVRVCVCVCLCVRVRACVCVCVRVRTRISLDTARAWDALRTPWANLLANLGQTWANLCRFGANLPGDGLRRARISRKKWDGRHPVIRAKYPYYNTRRETHPPRKPPINLRGPRGPCRILPQAVLVGLRARARAPPCRARAPAFGSSVGRSSCSLTTSFS